MKDDVLSGFSAVFESITSNGVEPKSAQVMETPDIDSEDKIDKLPEDMTPDQDHEEFKKSISGDADIEEDEATDTEPSAQETDHSNEQSEIIPALFDAIAETAGWSDIADDEKPKSVEELISYMVDVVENSSEPNYASEEIKELDEFVRNGGSISDYFSAVGSDGYDNLDLENESVQRQLVREFLIKKGFTEQQAIKKIEKYEDADILADEAADSLEALKEMHKETKKALLEEQKTLKQNAIEAQQKFYNSVVSEIEALTDIRGIKIPKEDKKILHDYIFNVESDGKTKYQKDYAKSTKNLLESAYFTMKGETLLSSAKKSGETSATEKFKNTLKSTKVGGSTQKTTTGPAKPIWEFTSNYLSGSK